MKEFDVIGDRDVIIVNTSRGSVVDDESIVKFLKNHPNSIYCTDVYNKEPYSGQLCKLDNTILTPHTSSMTIKSRLTTEKQAIENTIAILNGEFCENVL